MHGSLAHPQTLVTSHSFSNVLLYITQGKSSLYTTLLMLEIHNYLLACKFECVYVVISSTSLVFVL